MMKPLSLDRRSIVLFIIVAFSAIPVAAQSPADDAGKVGIGTFLAVVLFLVAMGAFLIYRKGRTEEVGQYNYENRIETKNGNDPSLDDGLDADKELEWFRKAKRTNNKAAKQKKSSTSTSSVKLSELSGISYSASEEDTRSYQERLRKQQFANLPINSFLQLAEPRDYTQLQLSGDPALLSAIEQANEEFEEDEAVRELALRILSAFKTRNSIDALSQIALYDLSSNLRSKAVAVLTDFDHESVFETLLLACADPTREVRAAAARGLFKLSIDRANAWRRLSASSDDYKKSHTARAAIESGIAAKSFDRLVHYDMKIAYEAFSLVALLILSGETNEIFETIKKGRDEGVKFALLHVLSVVKDERALIELNKLRIDATLADAILEKVKEIVETYQPALA